MTVQTSPRERRAARTRQAILDTARELIAERGVYNLSLREIARRVEYSPAGLYEYFAGKSEIIEAVFEESSARFASYLTAVSTDLPPYDYLIQLGLAYVNFGRENPQHYMLLTNPPIAAYEQYRGSYVSAETFQLLVSGLERAQAAGVIAAHHDITDLSFATWAFVKGIGILHIVELHPDHHDWEQATERMLRLWADGLA